MNKEDVEQQTNENGEQQQSTNNKNEISDSTAIRYVSFEVSPILKYKIK